MCNSCEASTVNGILCHEHGCPDSWMDEVYMCKWCGTDFKVESKDDNRETCCHSCAVAYSGGDCTCDECMDDYERIHDYDE